MAIIRMDSPGAKVNTLSQALMSEMTEVLDRIESDAAITSAVLISGKADGFIAGADITMMEKCTSAADGEKLSADGQMIMDRIEGSKKPFVAAIHGKALGGGLEVALACDYRIASSGKSTAMGLPEVQLGLLPGAGGTQRLPELVGIQQALTMATTGQNIKPDKAKRMGLVDQVADPFALEGAAVQAAKGLADGSVKSKKKKKGLVASLLEDNPVGRNVLFGQAQKMAAKKTGGNYPAVPAIMDCIQEGVTNGRKAGLKKEAEMFGQLTQTPEAKSLMSIFFGMTALKKSRFGKPARSPKTIGVLGAGLMGAGIAQVSAVKDYTVLLKDLNAPAVARGIDQCLGDWDSRVKKRKWTQYTRDTSLANIVPLSDADNWQPHFANCDLLVEAVLEEMSLKHRVIKQFEEVIPEHCVFATNTSALSVAEIATASKRPENVIGMHYFSPVPKMPLLEVITHDKTSDEAAAATVEVGLKQGKTVIVVKDVPGFYVNRSLGPYMAECMALLQMGVETDKLDKSLKKFGYPVGPIALLDEVGIDVAQHVQESLAGDLGDRMGGADVEAMNELVASGMLGRKTKEGFFTYDKKGKKTGVNSKVTDIIKKHAKGDGKDGAALSEDDIQHRMAFRFINEAVLCLQDGIIESARDGDIGAVFGIGFPPFRGGPFRFVDDFFPHDCTDRDFNVNLVPTFSLRALRRTPTSITRGYPERQISKPFYVS